MPLPKISTPSYELVLPSSKKKIKFRPFLVKEEKILILAMESEDTQQIASAVKDVIKSCILFYVSFFGLCNYLVLFVLTIVVCS